MEKTMLVNLAVESLPTRDRRIVALFFYGGRKRAEIAKIVGVHRSTMSRKIRNIAVKVSQMVEIYSKKI